MAMVAPKSPPTAPDPRLYEQLQLLPDHLLGEILDSEVVSSPRPAAPHTLAASALGFDLGGPFQFGRGGPGGWWILSEPELHLGAEVLVPELAGWRRERMPAVPNTPAFSLAPDWVCEVLSPTSGGLDRVRKLPKYAAAEVAHAWLIDPLQQTLEVFRRDGRHWLLVQGFQGATRVRAEPFGAIEIDLADLWLPAPPSNEPPPGG